MSRMVSARVPDAIYDQASIQLDEMGSSPSELINAAFEYLLREKSLPESAERADAGKRRVLTKGREATLRHAFGACRLKIDIPSDVSYDKRVVSEARSSKHAALA